MHRNQAMRLQHKGRCLPPVAVAMALALACSRDAPRETGSAAATAAAPLAPAAPRRVEVEVRDGGFVPSTVAARVGEELLVSFRRVTSSACGASVVFPELKIERELPLNAPVEVKIAVAEAGTIFFQCGMAMMRGRIVAQ